MKLTNRRIRLVLAVFAFAFVAMFARAAWLQGVRAGSYERLASGQHKATIVEPAGGDDLRPHRRPARDRPAGDDGLRRPAADPRPEVDRGRRRAGPQDGSGPGAGRALRPVARLRLHQAQGRPRARRDPEEGGHPRPRLHERGAARLPARPGRVAGRRLRGDGQPRPRGPRARPRAHPVREAGQRDRDPRPGGPGDRCPALDPGPGGRERHADARSHDSRPRPRRCCGTRSTSGMRRGPRRSCSIRAPAASSRWQSKRGTTRTCSRSCPRTGSATGRSRTPTSRVRRSSSSRSARCFRTGLVTPSTAFTLPYSIHVADRIIRDAHPRATER
jgi:Cell division protein FtsI/penicillin-binding protein 2